jgi:hypothetical protein
LLPALGHQLQKADSRIIDLLGIHAHPQAFVQTTAAAAVVCERILGFINGVLNGKMLQKIGFSKKFRGEISALTTGHIALTAPWAFVQLHIFDGSTEELFASLNN